MTKEFDGVVPQVPQAKTDDNNVTRVTLHDSFQIDWKSASKGFGQLYFSVARGGDTVRPVWIDSEHMSKEFIKAVLCKMVDDAELK